MGMSHIVNDAPRTDLADDGRMVGFAVASKKRLYRDRAGSDHCGHSPSWSAETNSRGVHWAAGFSA